MKTAKPVSIDSGESASIRNDCRMEYSWQIRATDSTATVIVTISRNGQTIRQYRKMFRDTIYQAAADKAKTWQERDLFIWSA